MLEYRNVEIKLISQPDYNSKQAEEAWPEHKKFEHTFPKIWSCELTFKDHTILLPLGASCSADALLSAQEYIDKKLAVYLMA
jgi:hypothetical protein